MSHSFNQGRIESEMDLNCLEKAHGQIKSFSMLGYENLILSFACNNGMTFVLIVSHTASLKCNSDWLVRNPKLLKTAGDEFVYKDDETFISFAYGELISEEVWATRTERDAAANAVAMEGSRIAYLPGMNRFQPTKLVRPIGEMVVDRVLWNSENRAIVGLVGSYSSEFSNAPKRHGIRSDGIYYGRLELLWVRRIEVCGEWYPFTNISVRADFQSGGLVLVANDGCVQISFGGLGIKAEVQA